MAEYIKKEDAINAIAGLNPSESLQESLSSAFWTAKALADDVEVIEIVRCKNCIHCESGVNVDGKKFWRCRGHHIGTTQPNDFCSYGSSAGKPNNSTISKMEQVGKE